jgi:hypothetical protein
LEIKKAAKEERTYQKQSTGLALPEKKMMIVSQKQTAYTKISEVEPTPEATDSFGPKMKIKSNPNIFTPPIEPFEESIWKGPPKYSKYSATFLGSLRACSK